MTEPATPASVQPTAATSTTTVTPSMTTTYPVTSTVPAAPLPQQYFTAEQLEAARQQEKDKVYDRLKKAEDQSNAFKAQIEELMSDKQKREEAEAELVRQQQEAERKAADAKLSAEELIARQQQEWQQEKATFVAEMEQQRALLAKEQEFQELRNYIQRRVNEEISAQNIHPTLADYVTGNTKEEVEASITTAKEKTDNIFEGIVRSNPTITPGVSPTGFGPSGPLDNLTGQKTYSPEEIANMSMQEYAAFRAQTGVDKAGQNRGMFS